MVRAAARGIIDFSRVDPFNSQDNRRTRLLLREVAAEDRREILTLVHRHVLAALSVDRISPESLTALQKECTNALDDLLSAYQPWKYSARTRKDREKEEAKALSAAWQQRFGSLDDPVVQERLKATRAALLQASVDSRPPNTPYAQSGIFNRETAEFLTNISNLERLNPNKS